MFDTEQKSRVFFASEHKSLRCSEIKKCVRPQAMPPIDASLGGRAYPAVGPPPNCTRTRESIQLPSSPVIESARSFRNF